MKIRRNISTQAEFSRIDLCLLYHLLKYVTVSCSSNACNMGVRSVSLYGSSCDICLKIAFFPSSQYWYDSKVPHTGSFTVPYSRLCYLKTWPWWLPDVCFTLVNRLQNVQNVASCLVSLSPRCAHITFILANLHCLPICLRIEFKILLITYKAFHDSLTISITVCNLRSSQKYLLIPSKILIFNQNAFSVAAPHLWKSLPDDIKNADSIALFKHELI